MKEKGETPVMFSHLGPPPRRRTSAEEEEEERVKHFKPEDSVYYHPTLNPIGAPPPGKPPMYKSSIGPRIPLFYSGGKKLLHFLAVESEILLTAVTTCLSNGSSPLAGKLFVVLGAGGAGKSLAYGAAQKGARVVVANRTYAFKNAHYILSRDIPEWT